MKRVGEKSVSQQTQIKPESAVVKGSKEKLDNFNVDEASLEKLFGNRLPKVAKYHNVRMPTIWPAEMQERLYDFIAYALNSNPLFKDYPLAREELTRKVCKTIMKSSKLGPEFYQFLSKPKA